MRTDQASIWRGLHAKSQSCISMQKERPKIQQPYSCSTHCLEVRDIKRYMYIQSNAYRVKERLRREALTFSYISCLRFSHASSFATFFRSFFSSLFSCLCSCSFGSVAVFFSPSSRDFSPYRLSFRLRGCSFGLHRRGLLLVSVIYRIACRS